MDRTARRLVQHRDARRLLVPAFAAFSAAVGLPGCGDVFHSTDDVRTACQIDAQASGCAPVAAAPGPDAADGGSADSR
jgi:hypothetical protein